MESSDVLMKYCGYDLNDHKDDDNKPKDWYFVTIINNQLEIQVNPVALKY